jgi:hypothetical protein
MVIELVPLAIAAAFWPTLLAIVAISLRAPRATRLLASFLVAGLITTVGAGLAIVYLLKGSSLVTTSKHEVDPAVDVAVGVLALVGAWVIARWGPTIAARKSPGTAEARPSRLERVLGRGAVIAFVAGVLLNVVPGLLPLVALKDIAELDYGVAATVALTVGFYLVMFAFVEIPLVGFIVVPERTTANALRFNSWLNANALRLAVYALLGAGVLLVVRGCVSSVS